MNTPLYLLRCSDIGLSMADLGLLSLGLVFDMFTERQNDGYEYPTLATDEDIDRL
jgi:hypothetical protein